MIIRAPGYHTTVADSDRESGDKQVSERRSENERQTLDQRIRDAKARQNAAKAPSSSNRGMGQGLRIAVELAAAIVVGTAMGIGLDRWLGTTPLFLILFFVLGCAAGFMNVMRTSAELDRRAREDRAARDGSGTNIERSRASKGDRDHG